MAEQEQNRVPRQGPGVPCPAARVETKDEAGARARRSRGRQGSASTLLGPTLPSPSGARAEPTSLARTFSIYLLAPRRAENDELQELPAARSAGFREKSRVTPQEPRRPQGDAESEGKRAGSATRGAAGTREAAATPSPASPARPSPPGHPYLRRATPPG